MQTVGVIKTCKLMQLEYNNAIHSGLQRAASDKVWSQQEVVGSNCAEILPYFRGHLDGIPR